MLDQQQEVTSFKTRTHHGSGQKETYNLKACVYLEDPRPAGERSAVDVPREMKLSLLRWDSSDLTPSKYPRNPSNRQHKQMPSAGISKDGVEQEPEAWIGREEHVAGAARRHSAESDGAPFCPVYSMREEIWMMCNLDDNLLFSQFHCPAETEQAALGVNNVGASLVPTSAPPEPNGFAPSSAEKKIATSTSVSEVSERGRRRVDPVDQRSYDGDEDALFPNRCRGRDKPPQPSSVRRTRREERVTFHARPTCHDFLRGGVEGRARPDDGPYRSQVAESKTEFEIEHRNESESASEMKNQEGRSGGGDEGKEGQECGGGDKTTGVSGDRGENVARVVAIGFKSGDCAVLDATLANTPSFLSVLNKGGACCEGRVTAIRFVPGEGQRLLLAAFSTGDAFLFDTSLAKEAPLGSSAEKSTTGVNGTNSQTAGSSDSGSGSGGSKRRGSGVMRVSGFGGHAKSGQDSAGGSNNATVGSVSSGSSGSWGRTRSSPGGTTRGSNDSSRAPSLPASFTAGSRKDESDGAGGRNGRGSRGKENLASERCFFVERNSVKAANPVCRWRVSSDRRDLTDMAFAPCEVDGHRLVALSALDGALRVVDFDDQVLVAGFRSWFGGILCLDWSPDGRYIVAGGEDDAVTLWCLETRACVMRGEGHVSWVTDVAFDYWTRRPSYYRFTSVGEDARICMWEHDEMAGSLLRGGRSLRGAPSANVQQRYRSSSEHQPAQKGVGEAALLSEGLTYQMKNTSVMDPDLSASALTSAVVSSQDKAPVATPVVPAATSTGSINGGGRRPLTLPSRGVSFIGGVVRRDFGGRLGVTAAGGVTVAVGGGGAAGGGKRGKNAGGLGGVVGSVVSEENMKDVAGRRSSDAGLISRGLSRQSVPKGEPLCWKRLSDVPLSQVMVVRAGVVTLCAEGLIKLWARPSIPPPLPPMPPRSVDLPQLLPLTTSQAAVSTGDDRREENSKTSSSSRIDQTVTVNDDPPEIGTNSVSQPAPATGIADGKVKAEASSGPASILSPLHAPPAFDALINTDMQTPRGDGVSATDGAVTDGTGKKKGFFRFFSGTDKDKGSGGRSGAGDGAVGEATAGVSRRDDPLSALAAANAKARESVEVNGQNPSSSTAVRSTLWSRGGGKNNGRGGADGRSLANGFSKKGGVGGLGRSSH